MTESNPIRIYVNQLGYLPGSAKTAVLAQSAKLPGEGKERLRVLIRKEDGTLLCEKEAPYWGVDEAAGDRVWRADLSDLRAPGRYSLTCGEAASCSFLIGDGIYRELLPLLCRTYYYQRCGMALERPWARAYSRGSCHPEGALLLEDYRRLEQGVPIGQLPLHDVTGGWHDAGDYGRYTSAAATAVAHLLYAWKWFPDSFRAGFGIPKGDTPSDLLNECLYELRWLLKMQFPDGSVSHKLTSLRHANFVMPSKDRRQLILFPASTMATGAFAAVMALASRTYRDLVPSFARTALTAAQRAWAYLLAHPEVIEFHNPADCNTGEYGDTQDRDERLWAAVELYQCTKEAAYLEAAEELREGCTGMALGWEDTTGLAGFAMLDDDMQKNGDLRQSTQNSHRCDQDDDLQENSGTPAAEAELRQTFRTGLLEEAGRICGICRESGYLTALRIPDYQWGSNFTLLTRAMLLAAACRLTGDQKYREMAERQMDYLLGVNAVGYSYVTGVGERAVQNPHNRIMRSEGANGCIPGYVSGGANARPADEKAEWLIEPDLPPMKCFFDVWECYSLNETAIYWSSPAVFLAAFLS